MNLASNIFRLFLVVFLFSFCNGSSRYFIKKEFPDERFSSAHSGQIIVDTTSIRRVGDKTKIIFRKWRFIEATKKTVKIVYEEYYDNLKETPDLTEETEIAINEDSIRIAGYRILIYELQDDFIAFYLEAER